VTPELIDQLAAIVGSNGVAVGEAIEERHRTDILRKSRTDPGAVVRPRSTEEVAAVLRLAHGSGTSVTGWGGGTGLVGGGLAAPGGILLSLERMARVVEIDTVSMTVTVEAGAVLQTVQEATEAEGLLLPLDLGARGSATIGGTIATNAGGTRVLRWGMMRDMVLGLEAVLADGTIVSAMGKSLKDNAGYDWKQLMIGSEGTLGIVTRAVLRLRAMPRSTQTALVACASVEDVGAILRFLQARLAGRLSSFELMWRDFYEFVSEGQRDRRPPPLPADAAIYILIEALGDDSDADAAVFGAALEELFDRGLLSDAVVAASERQRSDLWAVRDDLVEVMADIKPRYAYDVSMALSDMAAFVADTQARVRAVLPDARLMFYGHGGDGNLHVTVGPGAGISDAEALSHDAVYAATQAVGGSISAEHGIGTYKQPYIGLTRSPAELALMRSIKAALDPGNILNPGKVVPAA
jgi:FAD/FMN-containing dehydrogenase